VSSTDEATLAPEGDVPGTVESTDAPPGPGEITGGFEPEIGDETPLPPVLATPAFPPDVAGPLPPVDDVLPDDDEWAPGRSKSSLPEEVPCERCFTRREMCSMACYERVLGERVDDEAHFAAILRVARARRAAKFRSDPHPTRIVEVTHGSFVALPGDVEHVGGADRVLGDTYPVGALLRVSKDLAERLTARGFARVFGVRS
jgi:hypothetical protein